MTRAANHVGKGITMRTTLRSLRLAIATSMLAILALGSSDCTWWQSVTYVKWPPARRG